jgi:hypothetical protein
MLQKMVRGAFLEKLKENLVVLRDFFKELLMIRKNRRLLKLF